MWSDHPAGHWHDAMVTGNGTLGAMVYGGPATERIVVNHERLYEPLSDSPVPVPDIASALPEIRRLQAAGKYREAYDVSYQAAVDAGFPGIVWTDPYHPACAVVIETDGVGEVSNYRRETNFRTGVVAVHFRSKGRDYIRETFASRPDGVIIVRLRCQDGDAVKGRVSLVNQDHRPANARVDKFGGGYRDPVISSDGENLSYRCKYDRSARGYEVLARVAGGQEGQFDAPEVLIAVDVRSLENYEAEIKDAGSTVSRLRELDDFDTLLQRHASVHGEMFDRVSFRLGDEGHSSASNETLIQMQREAGDRIVPALLDRVLAMGRFGLICSSGEWPPNLMGIWNGDWRPKWSGDFTLDANVNLQIAGANMGALPEAIESYSDLVLGLVPDWRSNATNLYGCRGVMAGTRTDGRHNLHTHFSQGFPGHFWTAGAQWMVLPMWEHYLTTGDRQYLREKLLPVMEEIVTFYEDFLVATDDAGYVIFSPSFSPENRPKNSPTSGVVNATMDVAVAREAMENLIVAYEDLGMDADGLQRRLHPLMSSLPPYRINTDGALAEWADERLEDNYDHRHASHLYPVWPGREIRLSKTPNLFDAAVEAARRRGRGNGSAHGLAHMALIGARMGGADRVAENLRFMLAEGYFTTSLFTYHNVGRIYNADMLHSLPAVVMEMLLYSEGDRVEFLPALPDEFKTGGVRGLRGHGGLVAESIRWDLEAGELVTTLRGGAGRRVLFCDRATGVIRDGKDLVAGPTGGYEVEVGTEPVTLRWKLR